MENAILSAGINELKTVKSHVKELENYKTIHKELLENEEVIGKLLKERELSKDEEISRAVHNKKDEIANIYEFRENSLKKSQKKIQIERESLKKKRIDERVRTETKGVREIQKKFLKECREILKKDALPRICHTKIFISLFCPGTISDYLIDFVVATFAYGILPCIVAIMTLVSLDGGEVFQMLFAFLITELIIADIHFAMDMVLKKLYSNEISAARELRKRVFLLGKNISKREAEIRKDPDESKYGLEVYDKQLDEIATQLIRVEADKQEALTNFDKSVKKVLTDDIKKRFEEETDEIKKNYNVICSKEKKLGVKIENFTFTVTRQYGAYLGKEVLSVPKLDKMIKYLEKGEATNIGEAIALAQKNGLV